jgi:atypical dual specificity phosphatase
MPPPTGFSWVEKPLLAALARPHYAEDLQWLRSAGIEVLLSLTEDPVRRDWVNDAGLMAVHIPFEDMQAPAPDQLDKAVGTITRALERQMPVAVHCGAGMGRTGVVLAAWFVTKGVLAENAIARVRRLRPGSVETDDQEKAVHEFARRHHGP